MNLLLAASDVTPFNPARHLPALRFYSALMMFKNNHNTVKPMISQTSSDGNLPPDAGLKGLSEGDCVHNIAGMSIDVSENKASSPLKRAASPLSDDSAVSSTDQNEKRRKTQEEKKMDRILANRRSARKSRERRKKLQENLELSVAYLTKQNQDLTNENELLKQEMQVLKNLLFRGTNINGVGAANAGGSSGFLSSQSILPGTESQIFQQQTPSTNDPQSLLTALLNSLNSNR